MPNLFDYLLWRGDLSFAAAPFNEVDNLILAMLSFIEYRNIVPSELLGTPVKLSECLRRYEENFPGGEDFGVIIPPETTDLFLKRDNLTSRCERRHGIPAFFSNIQRLRAD